ncbi:hypothetical protein HELRODRAFT_183274 [Helobdella robusta]|uniref:Uncharacterized protein n=1 Tax=Helobdella robusta TaxID=6412 RepID=T1FJE5_HELRO|nr:hypothetical protein HELRODRAFT_183274 [Helobdella robusta]ESO11331.1 hypothetical protein HELRODRAFT_183274 [Helobdella robusta]
MVINYDFNNIAKLLMVRSHTELLDLFLEAVHMSTNHIDPDVQIGMGVLFNLTGEYKKAVDCFKTALQVAPEDSMLWNKLGATLANGQMSEQAITAYHQALNLRPGYVRTRFNLGVACVNLGAYREAVEHFLSALTLKDQTKGPKTASNGNIIWSSLRMALSLLGSTDLLDSCDKHDLQFLNAHFKLN